MRSFPSPRAPVRRIAPLTRFSPTIPTLSCRILAGSGLVFLAAVACRDDAIQPPPPPTVATVQVMSPIDTILDVGVTAQLTAVARDQAGNQVSAQFAWQTSSAAVLAVTGTGSVTAQGLGTATITATTQGSAVGGSIRLRVVQANLLAVGVLAGDAFGGALVGAVSGAKRPAVQTAWGACAAGGGSGNIVAIKECVDDVRAEASSATDPSDIVLVTVLVLFVNRIEPLLGL